MRVNWPSAVGSQLVFRAAVCLLMGAVSVFAQDKVIRLRNQPISTYPKPAAKLQPQVVESPVSGLFLVQFNDRLQPGWREELRQMRVELVRYVPDDAFIARFDAVSLGQVTRLSFVRWAGPYLPEHKIDSRLRTGERSKVRVLLSPAASAKVSSAPTPTGPTSSPSSPATSRKTSARCSSSPASAKSS